MKIVVFGLGYVGLSNAILLSQKNTVIGVDINQEKVDLINRKLSPIKDDDMTFYLQNKSLDLSVTTKEHEALLDADLVIIATPTNYDVENKRFDLTTVERVIQQIQAINQNIWILIKSTVGVGHCLMLNEKFKTNRILFSPEFLREGKALYDNLYPSRIIVSSPFMDEEHIEICQKIISLFVDAAIKEDVPTLITHSDEAEAIKLFSNSYLAMRVAFFNELDTFAELRNLSTQDIIKGVSYDPRIGDFYNNPSFGYGGYCLPKDIRELNDDYKEIPQNLISAVMESNETRIHHVAKMIEEKIDKLAIDKKNVIIGVYRLTMKSNSDNFRSPSILKVIEILRNNNYDIIIHEPIINQSTYLDYPVENNLDAFKNKCHLIIANRYHDELDDVKDKVYTRDLFKRD